MDDSGEVQTDYLKKNLQEQLNRLMEQLEDLEKYKDDMDEEEYLETKKETNEELKEFSEKLDKLTKGDISLVSTLSAVRLATKLAISNAFKTPEIIKMFANREPQLLRQKLKQIEDDSLLKKNNMEDFGTQKAEILTLLRHLGEQLTGEELQLLEKHNSITNTFKNVEFVEVDE